MAGRRDVVDLELGGARAGGGRRCGLLLAVALGALSGQASCARHSAAGSAVDATGVLRDLATGGPGPEGSPGHDAAGGPGSGSRSDPGVRYLAATEPPYLACDGAPLDAESAQVIAALQAAGGWGAGNHFQIDFGLVVNQADASAPRLPIVRTGDFFSPDCDDVAMPVPRGGAIEGARDYTCNDGDCHLIVADLGAGKLYEMWRAVGVSGSAVTGGCLAVWDMNRHYPASGRGEACTSADAGGFAIASMLPSSDEVQAAMQSQGSLDHALRFILPNARIRRHVYVHPGTHTTGPTSGGPLLPPYGARFRLRPDYPLQTLPSEAARVIARTLIKYGMFLADGGDVALTFESDQLRQHKWADLGLDSHSLFGIKVTDFQMVDGGARHGETSCVRN